MARGPGSGAGARPSPVPWDVAILTGLGAPASLNNRVKLWTWATRELGSYAKTGGWDFGPNLPRYNWIDTTLPWKGSSDCISCSQQSVQRYATPAEGVAAAVYTLTHGSQYGYDAIVNNLRNDGSYHDFGNALAASCLGGCGWGGYPNWDNQPTTSDPSGVSTNSVPTTGGGASTGLTSADVAAAAGAAGCQSSVAVIGEGGIVAGIGKATLLNQCQAKAIKGGLALVAGGVGVIVGAVLLMKALGVRVPGPVQTVLAVTPAGRAATVAEKAAPAAAPAPKPAKIPQREYRQRERVAESQPKPTRTRQRAYERRTERRSTQNEPDTTVGGVYPAF